MPRRDLAGIELANKGLADIHAGEVWRPPDFPVSSRRPASMTVKVTLTFLNGSLKGRKREFTEPGRCIIGRSSDCDLQLPSGLEFMEVSRHHCELHIDPPAVQVRDLGSRNGTFVNGNSIGQRQPGQPLDNAENNGWHILKTGDELRIGDTFVRVEVSARPERATARETAGRRGGLWPLLRLWGQAATPF
jgi:pSer/pThr/pTyr-binding forkhead associated (FHA) protein